MAGSKRAEHSGFTLVEVALAIVILAGSLVVLLGMQSSVIEQTVRDRHRQEAMLLARRIMAGIESSEMAGPEGDKSMPGSKALEEYGRSTAENARDREALDMFSVRIQVSPWGIPNIDPQALKRILLTVAWGDSAQESLELVYFMAEEAPGADADAQ